LGYVLVMFSDTVVSEYAKKVINLQTQQDKIFKLALDDNEFKNLIIDLNTEKQLREQSVDSNGNRLFNKLTKRTTYAPSDPLGRGGQPYQVFRTGDYYDSFRVTIQNGSILITSNPLKSSNNLFDVYTSDLEGLTDENLQILIDKALEKFIEWYERNLLRR